MPAASTARDSWRERAHVCTFFLRLLGLIFLIAFLSLLAQITLLVGADGLLPAQQYLDGMRATQSWLSVPTLFWIDCRDATLRAAAVVGALLSLGLVVNRAPRYCLLAVWVLYLSFTTIGQNFLWFQWDNLLLESAFFALFITPPGWRQPRRAPAPVGVFLMQWLLLRLHVESGAAKLLSGDPTWRDLTAMVGYYETAPLPTWLGWYAHHLPEWVHTLTALFTFAAELGVPFLMWGPRRWRLAAFVGLVGLQISVILTANYGFFNYLTIALCVFLLDDGHLRSVAGLAGRQLPAPLPRRRSVARWVAGAVLVVTLVPLSIVPFLRFLDPAAHERAMPIQRVIGPFRSINAYHLFATMTLVRREVVIEGSADGQHWEEYAFHYKPGDVDRAPPFVAPHQPRVDFQLWFLLLRGGPSAPYFDTLLERLLEAPQTVAPLFARNPFPQAPPAFLRVRFYRYRFSSRADRHATGAWWSREFLGESQPLTRWQRRSG